MNSLLFLQCDLHDSCSEILPWVFSKIRWPQQYKHIWSCVLQLRNRHRTFQLSTSIFHYTLEFLIIIINEEKYHAIFWHFRALASRLPICCFALRFDASDVRSHISGHTLSCLEVVYCLVSLLLDKVNPSGGFSLNKVNLVKPVNASDNSRSSSTFQ